MGIRPEGAVSFPSFSRGGRYLRAESPGEDFLCQGGLAWYLWAEKKPESGGSGAAPGASGSAHVPPAAGTRLPGPVPRA